MISLVTGTFTHLFIIFVIVLWHELGHFMMAKYFDWHVDSIVLWIFGGVMKTDEHGTCRLYEDILVTIAGPFQHLIIYLVLYWLQSFDIIPPAIIQTASTYNLIILIFNLLPIYPLDGGKLMFYLLSIMFPFRKAYHFTLVFSMIIPVILIILQFVYYSFTLSVILIMLFLFYENVIEWKNRFFVFRRFLLRRLEKPRGSRQLESFYVQNNDHVMNVFSKFKREKTYIFYVNGLPSVKRLTEKECLNAFFYNKKLTRTFRDIVY